MRPLGKLWLSLEKVCTGETSEDLDLFDCLKLAEQSVSLLGQEKVSLTYTCRLSVLYRLTCDIKNTKKLLSKHETSITKSHKTLFGRKVYKALRTATKIRISTKEISHYITWAEIEDNMAAKHAHCISKCLLKMSDTIKD